jgi:hypothetical protein
LAKLIRENLKSERITKKENLQVTAQQRLGNELNHKKAFRKGKGKI